MFIFSAWGLRTHCFSWDRNTRSGAGSVDKGCTQGPRFGSEMSIMAHHSSSTTAGQAAGLAYSILPQSKGFQASHFCPIPKGNIQHCPISQGMESRVSPQGSISTTEHPCSMQSPLLHSEMYTGQRVEKSSFTQHCRTSLIFP